MITIKINLQSITDLITNSSSEVFMIKDVRDFSSMADALERHLGTDDFMLSESDDPDYNYVMYIDDYLIDREGIISLCNTFNIHDYDHS